MHYRAPNCAKDAGIGGDTGRAGDIRLWLSIRFTSVVFQPLRWLELEEVWAIDKDPPSRIHSIRCPLPT